MASNNKRRIDYTVGFTVDKTGLTDLQRQLDIISKMSATTIQKMNPNLTMNQALSAMTSVQNAVAQIKPALDKAFDTKTGVINLNTLSSSLKKLNLSEIQQRFNAIGPIGQQAFLNISKAALTSNIQLKQTSSLLQKMGETLMNTFRWSIASSTLNKFTGSVQQAWGYVQHLDTSLNDIRIVTGKSADEMEKFAEKANKAAQALGKSTTDYTEASLIYYQQGLSDEEVAARTETTLKAASVTGQSTKAVSEELTAVWNGYRVTAEGTEEAVDKLAAVAATTAADLQELSTGMSKVAAAANTMGVDMDQLNATLATIESVTRQAPESVGTALKTIYARMGDLKIGGEDEDGLKLGDVASTLQNVGIEILDINGDLKDMGIIVEEIAEKWNTWTKAQQTAVAESVAGKRQYNNLFALFENWDMYLEALETSRNATGTLQRQQDIYMESTAAHIKQLKTEWEDLFDSLIDNTDINNILDGLTNILNLITNIVDAIGGGKTILLGLVTLLTGPMSKTLANSFAPLIQNRQAQKQNEIILEQLKQNITLQEQQKIISGQAAEKMTEVQTKMSQYWSVMSEEEMNASQQTIREIGDWQTKLELIEKGKQELESYVQTLKLTKDQKQAFTSPNLYSPGSRQNTIALELFDQRSVTKINDITEAFEDLQNSSEKLNTSLFAKRQTGKELKTANFDAVYQDIKTVRSGIADLKDLASKGIIPDEPVKKAETAFKNLYQQVKQVQSSAKKNKLTYIDESALKNLQLSEEELKELSLALQQYYNIIKNGNVDEAEAKNRLEELNSALNEQELIIRKNIQFFSEFISSITSLAFGISSITNLFDTLYNENLKSSEKIGQIISGLLIGVPMLVKGISSLSGEVIALAGSFLKLKLTLLPVSLIITGITVGIAALSFVYKGYEKELEATAEASKNLANKQQEIINKAKEEKDAINDLSNSYNKLYADIKNQTEISQSQKNEIYELVKAYGDNDLIVQSLAEDYDKLKDSINGVKSVQNQKIKDDLQKGIEYNEQALKDAIIANAKFTQRDSEGFDLIGSASIQDRIAFASDLQKLIGEEGKGPVISTHGHISYENLTKLLESDSEDLHNFLDKYQNLDATKTIRELLKNNNEILQNIKQDQDTFNNAELESIGFNNEDLIKSISNLQDFEDTISTLAEQAYKKGAVESEEAGKDWAKSFLYGYSDTLESLGNKEAVKQSLLEAFIPDKDDAEEFIKDKFIENNLVNPMVETLLEKYQKGGNVDLLNRPIIQNSDGTYSTVSTQTVSNENETIAINFTPYLVDENGNHIGTLSPDDLQKYGEEVIAGVHDDYYNLQIGAEFTGEDALQKASDAAEAIHVLQEQYYNQTKQDISSLSNELNTELTKYNDAQLGFIASHIALFKAMYTQGMSVSEILDNLSTELEIATNKDHVINIDVLINGKPGQKDYEEAKDSLFSDESFNFLFTEEDFEKLSEGDRLAALVLQRNAELQDIADKTTKQEQEILKERAEALDGAIKAEMTRNEELKEQLEQQKKLVAQQTGISGRVSELATLSKLQKEYKESTEALEGYKEEQEDVTEEIIDWKKQLNNVYTAINALNKDIDSLQSSYQSLQSIVEDYNDDGFITLDNLQSLIAMDSAYAASLEIQNGQMSINEEYSRAMIDAKLQLARTEVTAAYMAELEAIANGEVADSTSGLIAGEYASQSAIQGTIAAAKEGYEALMNYAKAKDAAKVNFAATEQATKAYLNKMQMIDNLASQPVSSILGKADKSKKSGSGSSKDPEQKKHEEHEIDIYRTINKELEQIESTLGRIQKINDHEWGIDAQKTLEEENKLLDQQLEKLEEKRGLQERDLSTRRKQLEDIGVSFTADGSAMTNAEEKLDQLYSQYNSMIDYYNGLSVEGQEAYKTELEAEKDKIDKIEKKMDEYESGFSEYQSTLDKILDTHYEAIANEINQFNNMIDVHLELNDAQKEWDKFWSEVVEDVRDTDFAGQIAASMKQLETLVGTPFKNADSDVAILTNHLKDTVAEVQAQIASANRGGEDSLFGDDTLASKENLTKYRDALMDTLRNAKEEIDNISETYLKMLDDAQDKIDKQVDGWNSIGDQIEHDVELIKLISGDKAYDALAGFYEKQYQNNLKLINTQKQSQDFWKSQIDIYKQLLATTDESSVEWQTYDEALKKSVENYRKATQDLDKTVQESIKDLQTWRENNVNAITDTLDKAMSKGLGLDLVEQEWKLINDYADQYYDNVERALNMQEYTNILDDAANAVGLTAENQEKLNNFRREELAQLNEKEKLTQYDIDESKARLEILKAEIALQDAQRNKSNMRLRRDNQGNYVYQYTGNDQDIENAENGMLTAKREWYELVKKRNKETNDYIIQLSKERIDLQNQLAQAQMDGDVERINLLLDLIKRNEEQQVDAFAWAEDTKQDLIKGTATYFADVENHDVLPMFEATVNHLVDRWAGDDDSFIKASITAVQKLQTTQDEYAARTKVVLTEAGINYQELREDQIDPTIDSLNEMVASNEELADELDNVNDLLREQESNLRDVEYAYYSLRNAAVSAISAAQSALNTLANTAVNTIQRVQAAIQAANNAGSIANNMTNNYTRSSGSSPNNQKSTYNPNKYNTIKNSTNNRYTLQPDVGGTVAVYYNGKKKEQVTVKALQSKYNPYDFGVSNWDNIFDFDELTRTLQWYGSTFATGGYTGSWGNNGKLAMLHEKELVLNKDDTSNILKAVNAIREVVQAANTSKISNNLLNSSNISAGILSRISAGFLQGAGNVTTSNANNTSSMVINADFSGVRNADEIYQALLELQNYGLQQNYSVEPNINIGY